MSEETARVRIRTLVSAGPDERPLEPRHMTSPAEAERQRAAASAVIAPALEDLAPLLPEPARADPVARAGAALDAFPAVFAARPVRDNAGGSGFNDSLWLWILARLLGPALIVESGTHKGHSAWLFRRACPQAEIHSFDVSWDRLRHREPDVRYHREDWSGAAPRGDPARPSLVFLDDHISHARRIREAHARGHRLLLLDDDFPAHQLFATGGPPLPTLSMILDPTLEDGREIAWTRNGKAYAFTFRRAEAEAARALIAGHLSLPDLAPATRQPPGSGLALVKLVD